MRPDNNPLPAYIGQGTLAERGQRQFRHRINGRGVMGWVVRKCTLFFDGVGFLDGRARDVWIRTGLLER